MPSWCSERIRVASENAASHRDVPSKCSKQDRKNNKMSSTPLDSVNESGTAEQRERRGLGNSRMNRIARRAREIYEARGGQHGTAMDDWLRAEREIDASNDENLETSSIDSAGAALRGQPNLRGAPAEP
jgi:DUF2934 family protein